MPDEKIEQEKKQIIEIKKQIQEKLKKGKPMGRQRAEKTGKQKVVAKKHNIKHNIKKSIKNVKKLSEEEKWKKYPTLKFVEERDIAMDFSEKIYKKFTQIIKSIVLFGSSAKRLATAGSDIDIIIIIDDCTIQWDAELIAWYREELGKIIQQNPYQKALHINSVKLSTWWQDLLRGDPVVINVIRWGEALIDLAGFFNPLKVLLQKGLIRGTPEAISTLIMRAPAHMSRSRAAVLGAIEGLYWACVDAAHGALIAAKQLPPSPESIAEMLREQFVEKRMIDNKYPSWYNDLYKLAHKILRGEVTEISGKEIDIWQQRTDEFVRVMAQLIKKLI